MTKNMEWKNKKHKSVEREKKRQKNMKQADVNQPKEFWRQINYDTYSGSTITQTCFFNITDSTIWLKKG